MAVGEWDQRQLCPDGGCVGVIGPDGTCKVCGRAAPNWGDERKRGLIDPPDEDEGDGDDDDDDLDADELAADGDGDGDEYDDDADDDESYDGDRDGDRAGLTGSSGEWGERRLCADGTCIGLLGSDGRCKVCGRTPAQVNAGAPSSAAPATASGTIPGATGDKAPEGSDGEAPP